MKKDQTPSDKKGIPEIGMPESRGLDLSRLRTYSIKKRTSKVRKEDLIGPLSPTMRVSELLQSLPNILAGQDLREVISSVVAARRAKRPVMVALGAHLMKVGLSPLLIDLMEKGIVTHLAFNGAGIIHDFELALVGQTSEDVAAELEDGTFGMAEETSLYLNRAITEGASKGIGIGESVGKLIQEGDFPNRAYSILAAGVRLGIPVTVHVALGTDIIHMHPSANGEAIGKGSLIDFHRLTEGVANLEGGVYFNIGSAVLLPEVFLKALTIARNLGYTVQNITVVNMDFLQHYRPLTNVVRRPTQKHGRGYSLTGHHEIMLPLLAAGILAEMEK